jgi:hypothetical protein
MSSLQSTQIGGLRLSTGELFSYSGDIILYVTKQL